MTNYLPVRGKTFPVKDQLKKMGGRWNSNEQCWYVPASKHEQALRLVGGSGGGGGGGRKPVGLAFEPTPEQAALRDFVLGGDTNLFCEAGAGAGKTTTSLWLVGLLAQRACENRQQLRIAFVAFNTDVKDDIVEKAPQGIEVMTMNALGFRALKAAWNIREIDVSRDHLFETFKVRFGVDVVRNRYDYYTKVNKLVELAKGALAETAEDLEILAIDYALELNGDTAEAIELALSIMTEAREDRSPRTAMSFTDQMWLAVVHNVAMPKYDVLVIDESQDTNALQLEMLSRCVQSGARVIAVGDRRQAIYGFRGADSRAVDKIVERFAMTVLPLMTTFRCAKAIVREAQRIVPQFRAGDSNPEGVVREINARKLNDQIQPGDFVISRTNAPLIAACIRALAAGVPAAVVGKDLDKQLLALHKKIVGRLQADRSVRAYEEAAEAHAQREAARLGMKVPVPEAAIAGIRDRVDCLLAFADDVDSIEDIAARIKNIVTDRDSESRVDFTSCHKAKGRERNRVFLFRDTFLLARKDPKTGEWMEPTEEEYNLLYVGITRAKNELVYVDGTKKTPKRGE